jgi:acetyltransferase EpsM
MHEAKPILIPLVNPNEPGALLAAINVTAGQHVSKGTLLCTLETTKSTLELTAESEGYVVGLAYSVGQTIQAGEVLAYLADSPDWIPPKQPFPSSKTAPSAPGDLRISQPALALAQKNNVDLSQFSREVFVTEKMVMEKLQPTNDRVIQLQLKKIEPNAIVVYGGGGHGKALIDLIRVLKAYPIAGIVDDGIPSGSTIMGVPVLGGSAILEQLIKAGVCLAANAVGGIGDINSRIRVFESLKQVGFTCPMLVHPIAFVEPSASLADGVQVMPHAYVGSEARVGFGAIINTGAIVSHDCIIGDCANLSPGAILAGEVSVGNASLIGMGTTINLRVKIGTRARIGNGATVKQDVPDGSIVRAGTIWPE